MKTVHHHWDICFNRKDNQVRWYSQLRCLDVPGCSLYGVAIICGKLGDNLQQSGAVVLHRLTIAVESCLVLGNEYCHSCFELWQAVPDVVHEQFTKSFCEVTGARSGYEWGVVALQENVLVFNRVLQALLSINVMLAPKRRQEWRFHRRLMW